jgi:hypothetical protein
MAETIKLSVNDNIYRRFFWTGPNGFTSNEREPKINFATPEMSGLYSVYYSEYDCVSQTKSIQINVVAPTPTCTVANNTWTNSVYNNNTMYAYTSNYNSNYTFKASGGNSDLNFEFSTTTKPVAGIYKTVNPSFAMFSQINEVRIYRVYANNSIVPNSADIYVTYNPSGKMNIKFCNLTFVSLQGYIQNFVFSANLNEQ